MVQFDIITFTQRERGGAKCRRVSYEKILTEISFRPRAQYSKKYFVSSMFSTQWACCWKVETVGRMLTWWPFDILTRQWACCRNSGPVVNTLSLSSTLWAWCRNSAMGLLSTQWAYRQFKAVGLLSKQWAWCRHSGPVDKTVGQLSTQYAWFWPSC